MSAAPLVGVDGGGSGCRARVFDPEGAPLAEATGGPANLLIGDGAAPFAALVAVVEAALAAAGLPPSAVGRARVGFGVAGATPEGFARFAARRPPFAETRVVTDGHAAALGAHGGADGAVVILGTGAGACVVRDGAAREIGGWGFAVDDGGSGAWIGRRLLRAALRAHDGEPDLAALSETALARWSGDPARAVDWAATARAGDFAALAPLAFALGESDPAASAILDAAAAEGARLLRLARAAGAPRVSLAGSVALRLAPRLRARLEPAEAAALVPPQGDAAAGAALALRLGLGRAA